MPVLLAVYSHYSNKRQSGGTSSNDTEEEEEDDIENDTFQDIAAWYLKSPLVQNLGAILLALGAFMVFQPGTRSTVICPASQSRRLILALQLLGVVLDACILTLAWRAMQWARTSRQRFLKLGTILASAAFCTAVGILAPTLSLYSSGSQFAETSHLGPLYYFHVLGQSLVLLTISSTLFALQYPPVSSTGIITFVCGVCAAWRKLALLGTYEQLSKAQVFWGIVMLSNGFVIFAFRNNIRHILFSRSFIAFMILAWMIGTTLYTGLTPVVLDAHPVNRLIYATRQEADRWKVQKARVSERLPIAVKEYMERHDGRKPPPNFDAWWQYAMDRDSQVIDHFPQIDENIQPFLAIKPKKLREEVEKLGNHPGIAVISIKSGIVAPQPSKASHDDATTAIINGLIGLIKPYSQHLADMELPINLMDVPRVLVPKSDGARLQSADIPPVDVAVPPWEYRQLVAQACPGDSLARAEYHSHNGEICVECANPQSMGHFLAYVTQGRDLCHQPDMFDLHGFFMSQQPMRPFSDLVPVFSRIKADQFQDILIPHSGAPDDYKTEADKTFTDKENRLFWRGKLSEESYARPRLLVGGHQERLSHLANNASADDYVTMLLVKDGDKEKYIYEKVPLDVASHALRMDIGFSDYEPCSSAACEQAKSEFGTKPKDSDGSEQTNSRYVMIMDDDAGPPSNVLKAVRSTSIPFVATIFKVHCATFLHLVCLVLCRRTLTNNILGVVFRSSLCVVALCPHRCPIPWSTQHIGLLYGLGRQGTHQWTRGTDEDAH